MSSRVTRLVVTASLSVVLVACARPAAPAPSVAAPPSASTAVAAPTTTPEPDAHVAAIGAFVDSVVAGDLTYRMAYGGDLRLTTDIIPIKGATNVSGADFASDWTYDFGAEYDHLGKVRLLVRGVKDEGYIKRPGDAWSSIKGYDLADSYVPFKGVTSTADVRYLGTEEVKGEMLHRLALPKALLMHPNTIPFAIRKEKVDQSILEVLVDDDGVPRTGTWTMRGQARVGGGVGQLQRIVYDLSLGFSKVGDEISVTKP